jgi:hypothetical protein
MPVTAPAATNGIRLERDLRAVNCTFFQFSTESRVGKVFEGLRRPLFRDLEDKFNAITITSVITRFGARISATRYNKRGLLSVYVSKLRPNRSLLKVIKKT